MRCCRIVEWRQFRVTVAPNRAWADDPVLHRETSRKGGHGLSQRLPHPVVRHMLAASGCKLRSVAGQVPRHGAVCCALVQLRLRLYAVPEENRRPTDRRAKRGGDSDLAFDTGVAVMSRTVQYNVWRRAHPPTRWLACVPRVCNVHCHSPGVHGELHAPHGLKLDANVHTGEWQQGVAAV